MLIVSYCGWDGRQACVCVCVCVCVCATLKKFGHLAFNVDLKDLKC